MRLQRRRVHPNKELKKQKKDRSNVAGLFKHYLKDNWDITAEYVKNVVKEIDKATLNTSKHMPNFDLKMKCPWE